MVGEFKINLDRWITATWLKQQTDVEYVSSHHIYEKSNHNVIVVKPAMSDSIFIDDKFYLLLGTNEHKWLPY